MTKERPPLKAITFDFWDTLAVDDSDEVQRKKLGLLPKREARLELLKKAALLANPNLTHPQVQDSFESANRKFDIFWKQKMRTPCVAERLGWMFDSLKLPRDRVFTETVLAFELMEVEIPPTLCQNSAEALRVLALKYRLGIVSDTIHTPGWGIRKILNDSGIGQYFEAMVFSDEVQACKPSEVVFSRAASLLNVNFDELLHVGDREINDIAGPLKLGMRALLYIGAIDRGSTLSQANGVCRNFLELPAWVETL